MTEESINETQESVDEGLAVNWVYEGETPNSDLASFVEVEATATVKDGKDVSGYNKAKGFYRFGEHLQEAVKLFGEEVVFSNFRAQAKIRLQALMRTYLLKGQSVGELLDKWKPGVQMERIPIDPLVAAENKFNSLSTEEQEAFLQKLLAKQDRLVPKASN